MGEIKIPTVICHSIQTEAENGRRCHGNGKGGGRTYEGHENVPINLEFNSMQTKFHGNAVGNMETMINVPVAKGVNQLNEVYEGNESNCYRRTPHGQ